VSTNGLISFRSPFNSPKSQTFTQTFSVFLDPIIAPSWADLIANPRGSVFFRSTDDPAILNRIKEMITSANSNFSSYEPTLAVIVTWSEIIQLSMPFSLVCLKLNWHPGHTQLEFASLLQSSFQVVLSTNGMVSFAAFIYYDPSRLIPDNQVIGFNAGDRRRLANIPVESLQVLNLFRIDGMSFLS